MRLACLALHQAEYWGPADLDLHVPHPHFAEAVAVAAAAPSEQQALEAAAAFGLTS